MSTAYNDRYPFRVRYLSRLFLIFVVCVGMLKPRKLERVTTEQFDSASSPSPPLPMDNVLLTTGTCIVLHQTVIANT